MTQRSCARRCCSLALSLAFVSPALRARQGALQLGHALVPGALGGVAAGVAAARRPTPSSATPRSRCSRSCARSSAACRTSRCGTRGSPPGARCTPTRSPRSSRPSTGSRYVMDEWRALALIAALKLWVAAFGAFLLARALSMRWPGALAGRARLRLQPVDGHVDLLSARERVGAGAVGAAGRGGGAAPAGPAARGAAGAGDRRCSSCAGTRSRAST